MNDMIFMLKYYNMTEDELLLAHRINYTLYKRKEFYYPVEMLKRLMGDVSKV